MGLRLSEEGDRALAQWYGSPHRTPERDSQVADTDQEALMGDFAAYNEYTEHLIGYLLERLTEDDVLAGATRHPRLRRWIGVTSMRENINDYRQAAHHAAAHSGVVRWAWESIARYHAFCLRLGAGVYAHRDGFDRTWLRAPDA